MAVRQPLKGNPEQKILLLQNEFSGGCNVTYSDDLVVPRELRYAHNFDLDLRGELQARKGFSENTALTELLFKGFDAPTDFPMLMKTNSLIKEIMVFKVLENTDNAWRELSECTNLAEFQMVFGDATIKVLVVAKRSDDTVGYWVSKYVVTPSLVTRSVNTGTLPCSFIYEDNLMNISHGEQFNKVFFTANNKGMIAFDSTTDTFSYIGDFGVGYTNSAYKPHGMEVRRIGFNVLGDDPLSWIDNSSLVTESIQGVYLTTEDRIPLSTIPAGTKFKVNVIYTGVATDFTITFKEFEEPLEATVTKDDILSTTGLTVYDVEFLTQPQKEVEMWIIFTSESIVLEPYIDFYRVGGVDPKAKTVESLNLGGFKIIPFYDRLLFYKGSVMWFSDINQYDYVPNFNFISLPLDNTDAILRIIYFRSNYIIFTRKRIYRLVGSFDSASLGVLLVNDDIGCISANSAVLVENELYFVSNRGLRSLKSDVFKENLDNIREFDDKIYPLVTDNPNSFGFVHKDQYILMGNLRDENKTVNIGGTTYIMPDVLRQYYKTNSFVFDKYTANNYPRFVFFESGDIYSFMATEPSTGVYDVVMYKYGDGYEDFDETYELYLETAGTNLGYPLHEKKLKHIAFKFGGEAGIKRFYVQIFGDGVEKHDIVLEEKIESTVLDIAQSRFRLDKSRLPAKCKNLIIRISTDSSLGISLRSIGYIFKLGKVRE